jgi:hypothetical protein
LFWPLQDQVRPRPIGRGEAGGSAASASCITALYFADCANAFPSFFAQIVQGLFYLCFIKGSLNGRPTSHADDFVLSFQMNQFFVLRKGRIPI